MEKIQSLKLISNTKRCYLPFPKEKILLNWRDSIVIKIIKIIIKTVKRETQSKTTTKRHILS